MTEEAPTENQVVEDGSSLPPGLPREQKYFLLVRLAERPVAVMDVLIGYPDEQSGFLGLLLVGEHGMGHGQRIMALLEDWLRAQGLSQLGLGVLAQNAGALRFWKRLGFERQSSGVTELAGQRVDVVKFVKKLR